MDQCNMELSGSIPIPEDLSLFMDQDKEAFERFSDWLVKQGLQYKDLTFRQLELAMYAYEMLHLWKSEDEDTGNQGL